MVLAGQFIALQNSWEIVSLDVWRVSRTTFLTLQWRQAFKSLLNSSAGGYLTN
jgi:hypothetical protein